MNFHMGTATGIGGGGAPHMGGIGGGTGRGYDIWTSIVVVSFFSGGGPMGRILAGGGHAPAAHAGAAAGITVGAGAAMGPV